MQRKSSLSSLGSVLSFFCALQNMCAERSYGNPPQWNLTVFAPQQFLFLLFFSDTTVQSFFCLRVLKRVNLYPFPSPHICLFLIFVKKFWKNSNNLNIAHCKMQKPTMIGSLCSISVFTRSTSRSWSLIWASLLNSSLLIAPCIFLSIKLFVTEWWLKSVIS